MLLKTLSRLSLKARFQCVSLFFLVVAIVPLSVLLASSWDQIRATRHEIQGLAPTRAILDAVRLVQQHRGLSATQLNGATDVDVRRAAVQASFDQSLDQALALARQTDVAPAGLAEQLDTARQKITGLAGEVKAGTVAPPDSFRRHGAIVEDLLHLAFETTRASGLLLDPKRTLISSSSPAFRRARAWPSRLLSCVASGPACWRAGRTPWQAASGCR